MAENAQDKNWPQDAGPSTYSEPAKSSTSYLDAIKKTSPAAYEKIAQLAKFTANENFGGKVQDYQAQLFTPLDPELLKSNKTLDLSGGVPKGVTPLVDVSTDDQGATSYNQTGYQKDLGVINGVPVTANYDTSGNLTGFQGDSRVRTFLDGSHSVSGNWDASGKPAPQSYTSSSGGFLKGMVNDIMSDPLLGTLATGAAAYFGGPLGSGALKLAQGKDFNDVLSSMAKSYVLGSVGSNVSSAVSPELTELVKSGDLTASEAAALAKTVGNVASNVVAGNDPLQALISGGLSAGTSAVTSQIPGFNDLSKDQQRVVNSAVVNTLKGGDPTQSLIKEAIASGMGALQSYAKAPSTDLIDQTSTTTEKPAATTTETVVKPDENKAATTELTDQTIPKTVNETSNQTTPDEDYLKLIGMDQTKLTDHPAMTTDPLAGMSTRGDYDEITGKFVYDPNGSMDKPLDNTTGTNLDSMANYSYDPTRSTWTSPDGTVTDLSYLSNSQKPMDTSSLNTNNSSNTDLAALARTLLSSNSKALNFSASLLGAGALGSALGGNQNTLTDTSEPVQNQSVSYTPQTGNVVNGVAYGLDQLGRSYTTHAAEGGIMSLAHGGQIPSLGDYSAGGNPRLLRGPGDGMSDNIPATIAGKQPARLADGEFVVPADVVSHLGNGSTEAGANVLYQMMERVRKARTGNPNQGKQINPQKFVPRKGK
jgi:hypothetical protein